MYYYIKGTLAEKGVNYMVVDAGGVGYLINTSLTSLSDAGGAGREITVYTYLHIREDVMELYGFTTVEEKNMFMSLISVSGVGPKAALAVLSVTTPSSLAAALITNDVKAITKASGVGTKMAQRIILELKDKIKAEELDIPVNIGSEDVSSSDNRSEAASALIALGYSPLEAEKAVSKIDPSLGLEEIIKKALAGLL